MAREISYGALTIEQEEVEELSSISKVRQWFTNGKNLGIFFGCLQGVLFSVSQIINKVAVSNQSIGLEYMFLRTLVESFVTIFLLLICYKNWQTIRAVPGEGIYVAINGFFYAGVQIFGFLAITKISALNATVILKSNVFTAILACIILKEKITCVDVLFILSAITGLSLVCQPESLSGVLGDLSQKSNYDHLLGLIFAIISSFSLSCSFTCNRKFLKTNVVLVNFVQSFICCLIVAVYLACVQRFKYQVTTASMLLPIATAAATLLGHLCLVRSLQLEKAAIIGVTTSSEIPSVFLLQICVLQYFPRVEELCGSIVIFVTLLFIPFREYLQEKLNLCKSKMCSYCSND